MVVKGALPLSHKKKKKTQKNTHTSTKKETKKTESFTGTQKLSKSLKAAFKMCFLHSIIFGGGANVYVITLWICIQRPLSS